MWIIWERFFLLNGMNKEATTEGILQERVFLEILQNSQEDNWVSASFLKKCGMRPATLLKKETVAQVFSCEFCKISTNTVFTEHLWATTYEVIKW